MRTGDTPSAIYKYFPPERLDVLMHAQLRYSPLGAFNDPFEGRPSISGLLAEDQFLPTVAQTIEDIWQGEYDKLPLTVRNAMSADQYKAIVIAYAAAKGPELRAAFSDLTAPSVRAFHESMDKHVGAACFSEVPDSLLMWAHYAAEHSGFVIEFDANNEHFHQAQGPSDEFRHLRRVLYREARPRETLGNLDGTQVFLVKSGHWSYEREWRVFRALREAAKTIDGDPFSVHLFSFPREAVRAVILGARARSRTKEAMADLLSSQAYSHVALKRAHPDETHFLLRIAPEPA